MPTVNFVNEKKQIDVPDGTDLRTAAKKAGINVYDGFNGYGAGLNSIINCYGWGTCGSCRVLVTKGMENTSSMSVREKVKFKIPFPDPLPCLSFVGNEETMRLACMTKVHGDVEIETGPKLDLYGENFFS